MQFMYKYYISHKFVNIFLNNRFYPLFFPNFFIFGRELIIDSEFTYYYIYLLYL